jgi:twitching motility protein PilI
MTERASLREYQQNFHRRLQGESAETSQSARLGVLAGGQHWLIRLDEAQEVLPIGPITRVPLTKSWFRGLVNVRGNLYSVIDFAEFSGSTRGANPADLSNAPNSPNAPNAPNSPNPLNPAAPANTSNTFSTADARIILIADRFRMSAALLVERMLGLRTLQSLKPGTAAGAHAWASTLWLDADGRSWQEIAIADLVRHNEFLQAGL